ncbi:MAG: o-succinylbenzoate synthase [Muribaculaceae bacterium]|nr:o-succinylbenzoate synthase [Muribaculaceae bacterium]MDE6533671.1 o-succinylbenzoate synthase [Muribaculaceae bacterium]
MRLEFAPYLLHFKEPGGTSRGVMTEKPTFLIKVYEEDNPEHYGIGEAAVFPGLSPEADGNYVWKLTELMANVAIGKSTDLSRHSSIQFGLEQALLDYSCGCRGVYFPSPFTVGDTSIEINGLVWMGDFDRMIERIRQKLEEGFRCIKLKIGAIDWRREVEMIEYVRRIFDPESLVIRVDANGGFTFEEALPKLERLADLGVHSIEQPLKSGNMEQMACLCRKSPLPIALDEELIGKYTTAEREKMLDVIRPHYIILKPALCGGFSGGEEWIALAGQRGIGWWVTSALESNVGLNAIAQWTSYLGAKGAQGLGTGGVFTDNFTTPVRLEGDRLRFDVSSPFDYGQFSDLKWHS